MQQQNYAEGERGNFKHTLMKLFHNTLHAPNDYRCYSASFLDTVQHQLSKSLIDNWTAMEATYGNTCDISIFCFPWFSLVWYYNPTMAFPEDKMSLGFFLDIAENMGDTFYYVLLLGKTFNNILTKGRIYPIVWNIINKLWSCSDCTSINGSIIILQESRWGAHQGRWT